MNSGEGEGVCPQRSVGEYTTTVSGTEDETRKRIEEKQLNATLF
jgi:hypothetical protein